jgi:hypothetical protein
MVFPTVFNTDIHRKRAIFTLLKIAFYPAMNKIPRKTLQDLEFPAVLKQLAEHCKTGLGTQRALDLLPVTREEELVHTLKQTSEYLSSLTTSTGADRSPPWAPVGGDHGTGLVGHGTQAQSHPRT